MYVICGETHLLDVMAHHADYANYTQGTKQEMLEQLLLSYQALSEDTDNWVLNLSNCSSLLWYGYHSLGINVNWAGFYTLIDLNGDVSDLILGPFQGKVACQIIQYGKGVCGTAISEGKTQLVPNVTEFPGHIACDGDTQSEIVVPLIHNGVKLGVLDIDCQDLQGFDETDQQYLEKLAEAIVDSCNFVIL